jgi:hypothetical protein
MSSKHKQPNKTKKSRLKSSKEPPRGPFVLPRKTKKKEIKTNLA